MTTKKEKLNAQQGFNQFLFETMMDRIRGAELLGQDIQKLQGQINSLKVSDAATIGSFKSLFPRVERLEGDIMPGVISGKTSLWSRVVDIERNKADAISLSGQAGDQIRTRLADHDESIESLSETVDQLSICKCEADIQMLIRISELERQNTNALEAHRIRELEISMILKRISDLEKYVLQVNASQNFASICQRLNALEKAKEDDVFPARGRLQLVVEKVSELEEIVEQPQISRSAEMLYENEANKRLEGLEKTVYNSPFSKIVMEDYAKSISSLKMQFAGLDKSYADTIGTFELKMKEQRGDYHDHIAQLVTENKAAHNKFVSQLAGLENRLSRAQDMIAECHPSGCIAVKTPPKKPPRG